ncbi:hypothetical protein BJ508DRAFT_312510 [Ascobolus immersus RN42]|uniref:Uncharacterized protein n=1 Tax=Ascobolus immersus RN42 TaxID=1160509 RepID=A0A3N4HYR8_ASCIM|nr:hypothetical protein BJ508DRAFT_312510 [Ascobolus immersus RN42]
MPPTKHQPFRKAAFIEPAKEDQTRDEIKDFIVLQPRKSRRHGPAQTHSERKPKRKPSIHQQPANPTRQRSSQSKRSSQSVDKGTQTYNEPEPRLPVVGNKDSESQGIVKRTRERNEKETNMQKKLRDLEAWRRRDSETIATLTSIVATIGKDRSKLKAELQEVKDWLSGQGDALSGRY